MADYLPNEEAKLDEWFQNWKTKMTESGSQHGFSSDEIKQAQDDGDMAHNVVAGTAMVEVNRREFIKFKRLMLYGSRNAPTPEYPSMNMPGTPALNGELMAGIVERTRSFVRRLKESANYNEAVGADFRVLPVKDSDDNISEDEAKPALKARTTAQSNVDIDFVRGAFDGVEIERQRGDNANDWQSIGRFYKSPAEDDAPPAEVNAPETRRYRARYLKGNKPIGVYSDIVTVVTQP
jgi:hypothetical protein